MKSYNEIADEVIEKESRYDDFKDFQFQILLAKLSPEEIDAFYSKIAQRCVKEALKEAAKEIENNKSTQSIVEGSNTTGVGAISQMYFRKGASWAKNLILNIELLTDNS